MSLLTIAIPTFERNEILATTLRGILIQVAQASNEVEIVIVDNASTVPVSESLAGLLAEYPTVTVTIHRNPRNIGPINVMKCLELTQTPWMWLMGDDDEVDDAALGLVLQAVSDDPEAVFINFAYDDGVFVRPQKFVTRGISQTVAGVDNFPTWLFMSIGVYKVEDCARNVNFGYLYAYSWAPHLAVILASLGEDGAVVWRTEKLIKEAQLEDRSKYWSVLNVFLGLPTLTDMPMQADTRRTLGKLLGRQLQMEQLAHHLIQTTLRGGDVQYALYTFDHAVQRAFYFGASPVRRVKAFAYRLMVKYPILGDWLIRRAYPLVAKRLAKGKSLEEVAVPDRWGRL